MFKEKENGRKRSEEMQQRNGVWGVECRGDLGCGFRVEGVLDAP